MRRGGEEGFGVSVNDYSCAHGAQINFGDLTPYLTYARSEGITIQLCVLYMSHLQLCQSDDVMYFQNTESTENAESAENAECAENAESTESAENVVSAENTDSAENAESAENTECNKSYGL